MFDCSICGSHEAVGKLVSEVCQINGQHVPANVAT